MATRYIAEHVVTPPVISNEFPNYTPHKQRKLSNVSRETSRDETLDSTTIGSSVSRETLGYSWPKSD